MNHPIISLAWKQAACIRRLRTDARWLTERNRVLTLESMALRTERDGWKTRSELLWEISDERRDGVLGVLDTIDALEEVQ